MPWSCDVCTFVNSKETFLACEMCQTPRSGKKRFRNETVSSGRERKKLKADVVIELEDETSTEDETDDVDVVLLGNDEYLKDRTLKSPWKLIRFDGLRGAGNHDTLSLRDIVTVREKLNYVVLATFDVNIGWLLRSWPELKNVKRVVLVHGCGREHHAQFQRECPKHFEIVSRCPKDLTFGTHPRTGKDVIFPRGCHHTKFMMLGFDGGMRFVIHTAALGPSFSTCTQGAYVQDFPIKKNDSSSSVFENTLIEYCKSYEEVRRSSSRDMEPKVWPGLSSKSKLKLSEMVALFDFSSARGHLLASVPGYHRGASRDKWGHLQVRRLLARGGAVFPPRKFSGGGCKDTIVAQFTSFASLKKKYRDELKSSFSPGLRSDNNPMGPTDFEIVWPTCKEVVNSIYGAMAGGVMPGDLKDSQVALKDGTLRTWCSDRKGVRKSSMVSERRRAMPHIKTFSRASADGKVLDWSILTSCNISKAAWGVIQLNDKSQFCIQSWEMGILFTPSTLRLSSSSKLLKLVTTQHTSGDSNEFVVPLPYELPTQTYNDGDVPWHWRNHGEVSGPAKVFLYS